MRRLLAILLASVLLLGLTACQKEGKEKEEKEVSLDLPYGLQFGMSYDDFCDAVEAGGLSAPTTEFSDGGYLTEAVKLPLDDPSVWDFIGSDFLKRHASGEKFDPQEEKKFFLTSVYYKFCDFKLLAKFDQDQKLRDVAVMWIGMDETFVDPILEDISKTYTDFFGAAGTVDTYVYEWENDKYSVAFDWDEKVQGSYASLILHDRTHDAES